MTDYYATKTGSEFHLDNSFVRLLLGGIGTGKSVTCMMDIPKRAAEQEPASDGIRYSRWAICRNTYPELKATTIKTWLDWMPEKIYGKMRYDSPISHHIQVADIDLEVLFFSLSSDADISKLKSLELTGIYFNELQFFSEYLFEEALERLNRYPSKRSGARITWTGAIADTNPPDAQHWIYKRFEIKKPEGQKIFKYVPAILKVNSLTDSEMLHARSLDGTLYVPNKEADYATVQQAGFGYWLENVKSHNDDTIKVNYMGQYGVVRKNKRVWNEYNDDLHCTESVAYLPTVELGMGWDFGRTPAVEFSQLHPSGYLQYIYELCAEDMNLDEFLGDIVVPSMNRRFPNWKRSYVSIGDPAGVAKDAIQNDNSCFDILRRHGIITRPAYTNAIRPRIEAVSYFLRKMSGGRPGMLVHPDCVMLRQGLNGEYYYRRFQVSEERYKEEPEKNKWSHPADAAQYIATYYYQYFKGNSEDAKSSRSNSEYINLIS